jgi:hypothetical protein
MAPAETTGVTQLLMAWRDGDESALEKLTPIVYEELHQIARRCMAGERGLASGDGSRERGLPAAGLVPRRRVSSGPLADGALTRSRRVDDERAVLVLRSEVQCSSARRHLGQTVGVLVQVAAIDAVEGEQEVDSLQA